MEWSVRVIWSGVLLVLAFCLGWGLGSNAGREGATRDFLRADAVVDSVRRGYDVTINDTLANVYSEGYAREMVDYEAGVARRIGLILYTPNGPAKVGLGEFFSFSRDGTDYLLVMGRCVSTISLADGGTGEVFFYQNGSRYAYRRGR